MQEVALSDWAMYSQEGTKYDTPEYPFSLRFHPTGQISTPDDYAGHEIWVDLMKVPVGSTLWEVWAYDKPQELGGVESHIADVNLATAMTTSQWGDKHFYVRHQKMDVDLAQHNDWTPYTPKFHLFGDSTKQETCDAAALGCPFAHMWLQ